MVELGTKDDKITVEEILKDLYCRQWIKQITYIERLGQFRGSNRPLMVSFKSEEAVVDICDRSVWLVKHTDLYNVIIMEDLPRSKRIHRKASNKLNEAARSSVPTAKVGGTIISEISDRGTTMTAHAGEADLASTSSVEIGNIEENEDTPTTAPTGGTSLERISPDRNEKNEQSEDTPTTPHTGGATDEDVRKNDEISRGTEEQQLQRETGPENKRITRQNVTHSGNKDIGKEIRRR